MNYQNYEYRIKVIETEYDYNKLTEREMETMTKEKREKTKRIHIKTKSKQFYENSSFEHKVIESALYNNVITYFVSQKLENKNKHYDSTIRVLGTDGKEINSDIYNTIDKMIPERKFIFEMEVEKLKNIRSIEILKCVFRIKQVIEGKMFYDYVTVSLPNENEEKQVTYKFLNNTKIESKLKKSTQIFVESIENYCNYGSGYQHFSIMGMYCNINKFSPLRGGSYIDLPQYFKDKRCIINVQNKDNRCFIFYSMST